MKTYATKRDATQRKSMSNRVSQSRERRVPAFQFVDNRQEAIQRHELQELANNSPQAQRSAIMQAIADNSVVQQNQAIQKKENATGLPDNLKNGIESLSGYSLDDVKVHYNSDKPAQLSAFAYAEGTDIHIASGQEKHLAHEAWHVVQQKQGRVKTTARTANGMKINNDVGLEKEADMMGTKAFRLGGNQKGAFNQLESNEMRSNMFQMKCDACKQEEEEQQKKPVQRFTIQRVVQLAQNISTFKRNLFCYNTSKAGTIAKKGDDYLNEVARAYLAAHPEGIPGHCSGNKNKKPNAATIQAVAKFNAWYNQNKSGNSGGGGKKGRGKKGGRNKGGRRK